MTRKRDYPAERARARGDRSLWLPQSKTLRRKKQPVTYYAPARIKMSEAALNELADRFHLLLDAQAPDEDFDTYERLI